MTDLYCEELFVTPIQEDPEARSGRIRKLVEVLNRKRDNGDREAAQWAARAVSPLLDYSSLLKLGRFVKLGDVAESKTSPLRLAILGGPTTNQFRQLVEIFLAAEGIAAQVFEGGFDLFRQEILDTNSALNSFKPQLIHLAVGPNQVSRFPSLEMNLPGVIQCAHDEIRDWAHLWDAAIQRWNSTIIQNNFEIAPGGSVGHYALKYPAARQNYLDRLNRMLAEQAPAAVVMHDMRALAGEMGSAWFEPRFHYEFKMPCAPECLVPYAHSVVSVIRGVLGRSKKVLVLDLDNTLWGGIVGDVGAGGIQVGQGTGEGEAFLAFQSYAKELQQRGILLAVCSKNDPEKAREPFEKRTDMILKLDDFSCFVANWKNKADNLRWIAERLDLKLDSFVFIDDNPAERSLVRQFLPEVAVPELPDDPAGYIAAVARQRYFETIALTGEDSGRARYYTENVRRKELAAESGDMASFLKSLDMRMQVEPINELNMERATQLMNKSNQFNLTTNRYTPTQIQEMRTAPEMRTLTFTLRDRLGDNGLISVVIARKRADALVIENWVMSCRVLQRGVEQFTRNKLVELAQKEGCARVLGCYIPTSKNDMVKDLFSKLGFAPAGSENEKTFWTLKVENTVQPLPHFIQER